ncbi:MAG TPA: DUF2892 domain-containing protein [Actinomycetaceae bacterium]|nr:DUF2892 domain-containing protein [Actinomycetaceae bacterium]
MSGNPRNVDRRAACAGPVPERALRAVVAVLLGGFAVSMIRVSPIAAITVGVIAIGIATVALTGRCPLDTFPSRHDQSSAEPSRIADARELVDISVTEMKGRS